jgi:hypothetical protein
VSLAAPDVIFCLADPGQALPRTRSPILTLETARAQEDTAIPSSDFSPHAWTSITTIRALTMDAIEQAQSGHPGAPLGLAPAAYVLWLNHLRHSPRHPEWPNRDRFVLSCGHASMLLYGLLHLTGYDLPMEELVSLQGSKSPPGRWGRDSAMQWEWRSPSGCWPSSSTDQTCR